jgi:hypothetical protein
MEVSIMYFYDPFIAIKALEDLVNSVKENKEERIVVDTETIDVEGIVIMENTNLIKGKCEE